ncbi:MAG: hypothetical protein ACTSR3_22625 [Candidatus Helarchaeota archaeon]
MVAINENPNIESVSRNPITPGNLDSVNITTHVTDSNGIHTVLLESNHSGIPINYTMDQLSGILQDGYWNFTIPASEEGIIISYKIIVNNSMGKTDVDGPFQYLVKDNEAPTIISIFQNPIFPFYQNSVNITIHITDNVDIHRVLLESNHTGTFVNYSMDFLSGTTKDCYWNFTFPTRPSGVVVIYSIFINDTSNNIKKAGPFQLTSFPNPGEPLPFVPFLPSSENPILIYIIIIGSITGISTATIVYKSKVVKMDKLKQKEKIKKEKLKASEIMKQIEGIYPKKEMDFEEIVRFLNDNNIYLENIPEIGISQFTEILDTDFVFILPKIKEKILGLNIPIEEKMLILEEFQSISKQSQVTFLNELKQLNETDDYL